MNHHPGTAVCGGMVGLVCLLTGLTSSGWSVLSSSDHGTAAWHWNQTGLWSECRCQDINPVSDMGHNSADCMKTLLRGDPQESVAKCLKETDLFTSSLKTERLHAVRAVGVLGAVSLGALATALSLLSRYRPLPLAGLSLASVALVLTEVILYAVSAEPKAFSFSFYLVCGTLLLTLLGLIPPVAEMKRKGLARKVGQ